MKRTRPTEEQIIAVLKDAQAGAKTADLARRHGVPEATICNWKAKYGGLESRRRPGDVVIMDDLSSHKRATRQLPHIVRL